MEYKSEHQYQGMLRSYGKLKRLATDVGSTLVIGDHAATDATKDFFSQCYHLKDWLKKDPRISRPDDAEEHINSSSALSLAADICNSFKHAGLDKPPRSGSRLVSVNTAYSMIFPQSGGNAVASSSLVLTLGDKKYGALDLASECVSEWDRFLSTQGLQFSKSA
jgi:hypothetical protein